MHFFVMPMFLIISLSEGFIKNSIVRYIIIALLGSVTLHGVLIDRQLFSFLSQDIQELFKLNDKVLFIFYCVMSLFILFKKYLCLEFKKNEIFWYLSLILLPMYLNNSLFNYILTFLFVWAIYYYFYAAKVNLFEKSAILVIVISSYLIDNLIFINYQTEIKNSLYLSILIIIFNNLFLSLHKKNKLFPASIGFLAIIVLKNIIQEIDIYNLINIIILSLIIVLVLLKKVSPVIISSIILIYCWINSIVGSASFVFTYYGLIYWSDINLIDHNVHKLTYTTTLPKVVYISGLVCVSIFLSKFSGFDAYILGFITLVFYFFMMRSVFESIINHNKNIQNITFGSYMILVGVCFYFIEGWV